MPTLSRRTMILTGVGVAGVAAVGVTAGVSLWPKDSTIEADAAAGIDLVRSCFAPLVGTEFIASATVGVFSLVLDGVEEVYPVRAPEDEHRFNLLFAANRGEPPAGICSLSDPETSESVLFLSAIGPGGSERRLQALVGRSV